MLFDKSVNIDKFKLFLPELRQKYLFDDLCLYMDNLSVHISNKIKSRMDELGFAYVFSPVYSPEFNGIEEVFAMAKKIIKAKRLQAIMNNEEVNLFDVVKDSFESIDILKIVHCIKHCTNNLNNFE